MRRIADPNKWRDVNREAWRKHLVENGVCPECHNEMRKIEGGYACDIGKDSCMANNRWPSLFHTAVAGLARECMDYMEADL